MPASMRWNIVFILTLISPLAFGAPQDFLPGPSLLETGDEGTEVVNNSLESVEGENMEAWDINDSLYFIPAYDTYCKWNTEIIHSYGFDLTSKKDTTHLKLRHATCDYQHPCHGHITSDFGERGSRYHYGIDLKLETGDPVKAAFEGVVRIAQYSTTYGNVVVIRHHNGLETIYAHLSEMHVAPGDHIEAGVVLGLGGNTGRSYGAHLHFECRYLGEPINPHDVIDFETGELKADFLAISSQNFQYLAEARSIRYHKVKRGDTLSGIAGKYGTSVTALCKMNKITRNSTIRIGQSIRYR
jgi:murein DD-endopeptidase MepM/ murein hydrolase activator NlpD